MQIVSSRDNLHECQRLFSGNNKKKYFEKLSGDLFFLSMLSIKQLKSTNSMVNSKYHKSNIENYSGIYVLVRLCICLKILNSSENA